MEYAQYRKICMCVLLPFYSRNYYLSRFVKLFFSLLFSSITIFDLVFELVLGDWQFVIGKQWNIFFVAILICPNRAMAIADPLNNCDLWSVIVFRYWNITFRQIAKIFRNVEFIQITIPMMWAMISWVNCKLDLSLIPNIWIVAKSIVTGHVIESRSHAHFQSFLASPHVFRTMNNER